MTQVIVRTAEHPSTSTFLENANMTSSPFVLRVQSTITFHKPDVFLSYSFVNVKAGTSLQSVTCESGGLVGDTHYTHMKLQVFSTIHQKPHNWVS